MRDSRQRARWETGDSQYSKPDVSRHLNSVRHRRDKSRYFTEENFLLFALCTLSPPRGRFPSASSWNFNRPAAAARFRAGMTFVIWLNPICPARRTCVKCTITARARLPLSAGTRSGLSRENQIAISPTRHDVIRLYDFRLSDAKIIRTVNEIAVEFRHTPSSSVTYDFPYRCNIIS